MAILNHFGLQRLSKLWELSNLFKILSILSQRGVIPLHIAASGNISLKLFIVHLKTIEI